LLKRLDPGLGRLARAYEPDPVDLRRRLRLGGERRDEHTNRRGQQEAAAVHHSMT
jgi:hypothetical protein